MKKRIIDIKEILSLETEMLSYVDKICEKHNITYYMHAGTALGAIRHNGPIPWDDDVDIIVPIDEIDFFVDIMRKELPDKYIVYSKEDNPYNKILFPRICMRNNNPLVAYIDVFPLVGLPNDGKKQIKFSKLSDTLNMLYSFKYRKISQVKNPVKRFLEYIFVFFLRLIPFAFWQNIFDRHIRKYDYKKAVYVMNPCGMKGTKNIIEKSVYGSPVRVEYSGMQLPIAEQYEKYLTHYYGDYKMYPSDEIIEKGLNKKVEYHES